MARAELQAEYSRIAERLSGRIAVAMSGGVDSSTAAALLVEQGLEIVGLTMNLWTCSDPADTGGW